MVQESIDLSDFCDSIISIISDASKYCNENNKNKTCFIKNKHINCNDKQSSNVCEGCAAQLLAAMGLKIIESFGGEGKRKIIENFCRNIE